MPYDVFMDGEQHCVYKLDENDDKTGLSLGCHDTVEEAIQQVEALYAAEEGEVRTIGKLHSLFNSFTKSLKELLPKSKTDRAMSLSRIQEAIWNRLMMSEVAYEDYPIDLYADDDNSLYLLTTREGKLFRYPLLVQQDDVTLGEAVQVMEVHQPITTRTIIRQQEDGRYRWFSVSGTAVLNRSGEIDSRELFDSFIEHKERTGEYPYRTFYHQGQAYRTGQADYLARDDYCYITSGLYDDTPLAQAEILARQSNPDYWGDSIGFLPKKAELTEIANGIKIPVYRSGINKEISTVPENEAAHWFTRTEVTRMSLTGKAWDAFVKLWGDDEEKARQWLEANPEARNRAIEDAGLITRTEQDDLVKLFTENKEAALAKLEEMAKERTTQQPVESGSIPQELVIIDDTVIEAVARQVIESETVVTIATELETAKAELVNRDNEIKALSKTVTELKSAFEKLVTQEVKTQQQIADDTPAKFQQQARVIYRPRIEHANGSDNQSHSDRAKANLPKGAY